MTQYIDKSALVAEINRILSAFKNSDAPVDRLRASTLIAILSFIDTLEVKEVDINKEISQFIDSNFEKATIGHKLSLRRTAKHFFELGLKTQYSSINIPNIDDLFEEDGINPYSKDAKLFKECYYTALERYKEKKGIV